MFVQNLTHSKAVKLLHLYDQLQELTGLQINPSKSTYLAIGSLDNEFTSMLATLASKKSSIEHLGVVLLADFHQAQL